MLWMSRLDYDQGLVIIALILDELVKKVSYKEREYIRGFLSCIGVYKVIDNYQEKTHFFKTLFEAYLKDKRKS